jgi:hypothetical protein
MRAMSLSTTRGDVYIDVPSWLNHFTGELEPHSVAVFNQRWQFHNLSARTETWNSTVLWVEHGGC